MKFILSLGAINKLTGEYVYPKIANKKDKYICPECNKDLILCQGEKIVHHFRHKVDSVNPCHHFSKPTESQQHKEGKWLLKFLFESKTPITVYRICCCCKKNEEYEIPEMTEGSVIQLEHRFEYNGPKIADVAYLDNGEFVGIFEICNTHKTRSEDRPEPWFEIDAETLIKMANDNTLTSLQIPCIRCEKCDECIEKENANLKNSNIEKYVRMKLGQKYPIPDYDEYGRPEHLRINFDAQENTLDNKNIIELFNEDFINKKIVIHSHKGGLEAYIISELSYNNYDYWTEASYNRCRFPYEEIIDMWGEGTIDIIIKLIKYCQNMNSIKQEKMNKIKMKINNNRNPKWKNDIHGDDDADILRMMRYDKQEQNYKKSLTQELVFIEHDIHYVLGNNIITVEHPVTSTKLKRSLVNNKTFYKGKWRTDVSIKLIIDWYHSNYDLIDELIS
jgi:uncharacterized protein YkuJ